MRRGIFRGDVGWKYLDENSLIFMLSMEYIIFLVHFDVVD